MDPASSLILSPEELLVIWANLTQHPTDSNQAVRRRIKAFLENGGVRSETRGALSGVA